MGQRPCCRIGGVGRSFKIDTSSKHHKTGVRYKPMSPINGRTTDACTCGRFHWVCQCRHKWTTYGCMYLRTFSLCMPMSLINGRPTDTCACGYFHWVCLCRHKWTTYGCMYLRTFSLCMPMSLINGRPTDTCACGYFHWVCLCRHKWTTYGCFQRAWCSSNKDDFKSPTPFLGY